MKAKMIAQSNDIDKTIVLIAESISRYKTSKIGLFSGMSGLALFELVYANHYDSRHISTGLSLLRKVFRSITVNQEFGIGSGITGVAWLLNYINSKNWDYVDDIDSTLLSLDSYIMSITHRYLNVGYYDYIYGYIGIGHYLTNRYKYNNSVIYMLDNIIDHLKEQAIYDKAMSIKWVYKESSLNADKINLSLSHGMSSIVIFLSNLYKLNLLAELN